MAQIIQNIDLQVAKPNIFQAIAAKQSDENSRFLKVTFKNGDEIIPATEGDTVFINAERQDGESQSAEGVINEDGTVTVPLFAWMLQIEGTVICDVSIVDSTGEDAGQLTSTSFEVLVEKAANFNGTVIGGDSYNAIVEILTRIEEENLGVDQTFDGNSTRAQSGVAIAEALAQHNADVKAHTSDWQKIKTVTLEETITQFDTKNYLNKGDFKNAIAIKMKVPQDADVPQSSVAQVGVPWKNNMWITYRHNFNVIKNNQMTQYIFLFAKEHGSWNAYSICDSYVIPQYPGMIQTSLSGFLTMEDVETQGDVERVMLTVDANTNKYFPVGTTFEIYVR